MKTREANIEALKQAAKRLRIKPGDVKVRPSEGDGAGMRLTFNFRGAVVTRDCASGATRDENFNHLVSWLGDLVRNMERRIETMEEAFHADGVPRLTETAGDDEALRDNWYKGAKTPKDSLVLLARSLERLGLSEKDVKVTWSDEHNEARLKLRLPDGRVMEKVSTRQDDARKNLAALALWLRCRALHVERGIETMERVASAYLLGAGG